MKKWKLAGLLVSQAVLTYAVFVICIHEPKSIAQQVKESVGVEQDNLYHKEAKLRSIIFKNVEHPTTVTIERVRKDTMTNLRRTELEILSAEDAAFLADVANGK